MDPVILHISNVAKKYPGISRILLFGSRAKGTHTPKSDYDFAVFWNGTDPTKWGEFTEFCREGNPTLNQLDLVRMDLISAEFQQRALAEGQTVYEKD